MDKNTGIERMTARPIYILSIFFSACFEWKPMGTVPDVVLSVCPVSLVLCNVIDMGLALL